MMKMKNQEKVKKMKKNKQKRRLFKFNCCLF